MRGSISNANENPRPSYPPTSFRKRLTSRLAVDQLSAWPGYTGLLILVGTMSLVGAIFPLPIAYYFLIAAILLPCMFFSVFHLRFGIFLLLMTSFFLLGIKRILGNPPIDIYLDISLALMLTGLASRMVRAGYWPRLSHPVTWLVLIWIGYNLMQIGNPEALSERAWLFTMRSMAGWMALYFVGLYAFEKIDDLKQLLSMWIILSAFAGGYGIIQGLGGFQPFERAWMENNIEYFWLVHEWGQYRVFSFLSDPAVLGILMASTSLLSLILLLTFDLKGSEKVMLSIVLTICLSALVMAGTRTAYVLIPIGLFFFALLTLNKKVLLTATGIVIIGGSMLLLPTENAYAAHMRSAFQPWNLTSLQSRQENWKEVQPFIRQNPLGAGLGTTGLTGQKYSPHTLLARFFPDSGFVRIAVEGGWIGLFLYFSLIAGVLITGVRGYFRNSDSRTRAYYPVFLTLIILMLYANFTQEANSQIPISLFLFVSMAIVVKLPHLNSKAESGFDPTRV